jgi:hypothetical protein
MRIAYRSRQFFRAVAALATGDLTERDRAEVAGVLPEGLRALFFRMALNDQRHSLEVYRRLVAQGYADRDLLIAALLHDCGRSLARIALWQRVALVLAKARRPAMLDRLAGPDAASSGESWRYAFYVQREHARLGAELAVRAGASPIAAAYIRRHEAPPEATASAPDAGRLQALQRADSVS